MRLGGRDGSTGGEHLLAARPNSSVPGAGGDRIFVCAGDALGDEIRANGASRAALTNGIQSVGTAYQSRACVGTSSGSVFGGPGRKTRRGAQHAGAAARAGGARRGRIGRNHHHWPDAGGRGAKWHSTELRGHTGGVWIYACPH